MNYSEQDILSVSEETVYYSLQESLLFTDCSSFVLSLSLFFIVLLLLVTIPAGSPLLLFYSMAVRLIIMYVV